MAGQILDYFSGVPRQSQVEVLKIVEREWSNYEVFIINAPVAAGKSRIAHCIAKWAGSASILTPNNILARQYAAEFDDLHWMRSKASFFCVNAEISVDRRFKINKQYCEAPCDGCDAYLRMRDGIGEARVLLGNYYSHVALTKFGSHKPVLIMDEAHNLTGVLREFGGRKVWQPYAKFPDNMKSRLEMMAWAETIPQSRLDKQPSLKLFRDQILSNQPKYLFELTRQYNGKLSKDPDDKIPLIRILPVDTRGLSTGEDILWPQSRKLILMSATISQYDIAAFGLDKKRVKYIEAPSAISADRRPVIVPAEHNNMSYAQQEINIPNLILFLNKTAEIYSNQKGLIHAPYNLALKLRELLADNSRFVFHGRRDKITVYESWRADPEPRILIASGMNEGVSLDYDSCRWQVICKVPFPSLGDLALQYMAKQDPKWYSWQSVRDLVQAYGRVCRAPDDFGTTIIYDSSFMRLFDQNPELFADWFKQALQLEVTSG